jgi:hypothetical protein
MENYDNAIITDKQINNIEDKISLALNCEIFNFASKGVVHVDRDSQHFSQLLDLALEYAKVFNIDEEIQRLSLIKEKLNA